MQRAHPTIRAIAFDYGGVLAYFIDEASIAKMAEVAQVEYEPFTKALWAYRQELDSGLYDPNSYWKAVLNHCGGATSSELLIETLNEMDLAGFSQINQKMIAWATTLKERGFTLLIISNMAEPTYQRLIANQRWAELFDDVIISGVIGINKPDQRIFEHAIQALGCDASHTLFIDDLPHNVLGAKKAGLHALQFTTTDHLAQEITTHFPRLPIEGLL